MIDKSILDKITIQDMPNIDMQLVAEYCGIEVALSLMRQVGGMSLYIPKRPFYRLLERIIAKNKGQVDIRDLAMTFGVTERYIQQLIQKIENATNNEYLESD